MDLTALTLFGRARYHVLARLFGLRQGEAIHLREVARRAGVSATAAQYELRLLVQAGLAIQERSSGRTLYRVNAEHPIAGELRSIIEKTHGGGAEAAIEDDSIWSRKRAQQRAHYRSRSLASKSLFLADRKLVSAFVVDFGVEREP